MSISVIFIWPLSYLFAWWTPESTAPVKWPISFQAARPSPPTPSQPPSSLIIRSALFLCVFFVIFFNQTRVWKSAIYVCQVNNEKTEIKLDISWRANINHQLPKVYLEAILLKSGSCWF